MNTRALRYLSCAIFLALTTSTINAGQHRRGNHFASKSTRNGGFARSISGSNRFAAGGQRWSGQRFASHRNWSGQRWNGGNWSGQHWNSNHWSDNWSWHHHHHHHHYGSSVVFLDFGFPFLGWWGYPYYYDYYPYGYGYYPNGYYGSGGYGAYGYNYGSGYGYDNGYGYNNGYSNQYDAKVAELQRKLANAGYYRGEIDGIFGSRTQYALKAYRHDHPNGNGNEQYGNRQYPTLRDRPYSPPPTTTEPESNE